MFHKSNPEGYKKMLDGVERIAPVHGERTMLTTVRFRKCPAAEDDLQRASALDRTKRLNLEAPNDL
jgi:hypothetical protein